MRRDGPEGGEVSWCGSAGTESSLEEGVDNCGRHGHGFDGVSIETVEECDSAGGSW